MIFGLWQFQKQAFNYNMMHFRLTGRNGNLSTKDKLIWMTPDFNFKNTSMGLLQKWKQTPTLRMRTYGKPSGPMRLPLTSICFSHWMWGWGSLNTLHSNSTSLPTTAVRLAGRPACRIGLCGERSATQPKHITNVVEGLKFDEQSSTDAISKTNRWAIIQK